MDKTIEEIAIESRKYHKDESFKTFNKELTFRMDDWAYGYCQGATEQEAITKQEMIDKACEWLKANVWNYYVASSQADNCGIDDEKLLYDFSKAMEE